MITNDSGFLWGSTKGAPKGELRACQNLSLLHVHFLNAETFVRYVDNHLCPPSVKGNFLVNREPVSLSEHTYDLPACNE